MNASVVGIGKLGLCFALTLEKSGYNVIGVDVNQEYVDLLNQKALKSSEPDVTKYLRASKNFKATTSLEEAVSHSATLFVIVATPSLVSGRYDHSQVDALVDELESLGAQHEERHFIVCCTTMPGYCESIKSRLNRLNYTVSYNPEFIAQGTILKNQESPDMILIGEGSQVAGDIIEEIYERHTVNEPRICRMGTTEAEITKISLNCFLTTNDMGIDAAISLASDKSNADHLGYQVRRHIDNGDKDKEIVFDYVSYKPESTLLVESQQLAYAVEIAKNGFKVKIREREEIIVELRSRYGDLFTYERRD